MRTDDDVTPRLAADAAVTAGLLDSGRPLAWASGMMLLVTAVVWLKGHPVHLPALVGTVVMASLQGFLHSACVSTPGSFASGHRAGIIRLHRLPIWQHSMCVWVVRRRRPLPSRRISPNGDAVPSGC